MVAPHFSPGPQLRPFQAPPPPGDDTHVNLPPHPFQPITYAMSDDNVSKALRVPVTREMIRYLLEGREVGFVVESTPVAMCPTFMPEDQETHEGDSPHP